MTIGHIHPEQGFISGHVHDENFVVDGTKASKGELKMGVGFGDQLDGDDGVVLNLKVVDGDANIRHTYKLSFEGDVEGLPIWLQGDLLFGSSNGGKLPYMTDPILDSKRLLFEGESC